MLKEWTGDLEVQSINQSIDLPLAKDYDAIVELEFDGFRYRIAVRLVGNADIYGLLTDRR